MTDVELCGDRLDDDVACELTKDHEGDCIAVLRWSRHAAADRPPPAFNRLLPQGWAQGLLAELHKWRVE